MKNKKETSIETAYYVLSKEPIIVVSVWPLWLNPRIGKFFLENFKGKKVNFILMLWWSSEAKYMVNLIKFAIKSHKKKNPEHTFTFLCNSKQEYGLFRKFNIPCIFCNHNALIDEKLFSIVPKEKKKYDVIYNAQMAWFKRHRLASKIDNLALITYFDGVNSSKLCYMVTRKMLSGAAWLNKPTLSGKNKYLAPFLVSKYLNQARVGLCLSAKEGTMYASTEYLLCGLPVVSTKSVGGRDVFFDKKYVMVVDDNKVAVREAVEEMIKRDIAPEDIRRKTLEKIKTHRKRFISLIQKIYDKEGVDKKFEDEWNNVFINKMFKWEDVNLINKYLKN